MDALDRRRFIGACASGAAGLVVGASASGAVPLPAIPAARQDAPAENERVRLAVQLYSVREDAAKDLPGVLEAVGKMGYEGVEFAGYYGHSAEDIRKMLDDNGLACAGTHIGLDTLRGDELEKSIEFHQTIGNKHPIVPGLGGEYTGSIEGWKRAAEVFNEVAEALKPHGMKTGYHNHSIEFKPIDGETPWDVFFGNTVDDVIMQLDTGNAMHGGAESVPILKRYPGRAVTLHCKEFSADNAQALVGEGDLPWEGIFEVCESVGGTEWYIVEQESYAYPPMECIERCLKNLKDMGK